MGSFIGSISKNDNQFLSLLRLGVGKESEPLQGTVDWDVVEILAVRHGLLSVVYDAVQQLPEDQRPPQGGTGDRYLS